MTLDQVIRQYEDMNYTSEEILFKLAHSFKGHYIIDTENGDTVIEINKGQRDLLNTILEDNDTAQGGVSYENETLGDFLTEIGMITDFIQGNITLEEVNKELNDCGIKGVFDLHFKSDNLRLLFEVISPYDWAQEYEINTFKELETYYNDSKEEIIYNLLNMIIERDNNQ